MIARKGFNQLIVIMRSLCFNWSVALHKNNTNRQDCGVPRSGDSITTVSLC